METYQITHMYKKAIILIFDNLHKILVSELKIQKLKTMSITSSNVEESIVNAECLLCKEVLL